MTRKTVFLDQGEFMGGAEHFLLDFLGALSPTERRRLNPLILGGKCADYQAKLPSDIAQTDFVLPAVKGGLIGKFIALWKLLWTAKRLKKTLKTQAATQICTNTPRAHLTVLMLKMVWGWRGNWAVIVHDFTLRPHWLVQKIGAKADVVVANSMPTRQWLRQHLRTADHTKLRLIENGFNVPADSTPATELVSVLNLGRIDPRKGQLYLAEAADLLQERNPDVTFTIIGDSVASDANTTEYETQLKEFTKQRQLSRLSFKPSVSDALATIAEYDALVFTPTEGETFGRVVIEALASGKLAIAFAQTGPKEILEHYERWLGQHKKLELPEPGLLLVEPNNAMSLAERVAYFADNPNMVELYTKNAAEFVAQNYSLAETKKRLLEVFVN